VTLHDAETPFETPFGLTLPFFRNFFPNLKPSKSWLMSEPFHKIICQCETILFAKGLYPFYACMSEERYLLYLLVTKNRQIDRIAQWSY